jgi:(hydroxyamino)benzene mutase
VVDTPDMSGNVSHHDSKIGDVGGGGGGGGGRHPDDPDPVRASKARAVWWLGLLAVLTGPLVGGIVPATLALALAAAFRREAYPAGGFLTGAALVRRGERLARIGIVLVVLALAAAAVIGLFRFASTPSGPDFPSTVN